MSAHGLSFVPYAAAELQPPVRCAHRPIHPCPHPVVVPRQKVGWTQLHHPDLSSSYLHCFSLPSDVGVSPYSSTLKVFLAMSCCTEMVYFPRDASDARGKDRSTMPWSDFTFSHSAIRLYSGSCLGKDTLSHKSRREHKYLAGPAILRHKKALQGLKLDPVGRAPDHQERYLCFPPVLF